MHVPLELDLESNMMGEALAKLEAFLGLVQYLVPAGAICPSAHPTGSFPPPPHSSYPEASVLATALPQNRRSEALRGSRQAGS